MKNGKGVVPPPSPTPTPEVEETAGAPVFLIAIIVVLGLAATGGVAYHLLVMSRKDDGTTPGTPA